MVGAAPANRGGAVSLVGAFKFGGNALAPLIWVPVYAAEPMLAFVGAGACSALVALATWRAAQPAQGPVDTGPPTSESARATTEFGTP